MKKYEAKYNTTPNPKKKYKWAVAIVLVLALSFTVVSCMSGQNEVNVEETNLGETAIESITGESANALATRPEEAEHIHNYIITEEKETECCTDGYAVYVCSCGDQYTKTSKARGYHDWSEWEIVREATTTKEGLMQRSCPDCEKIEEKTIAKLVEETKPTATQPVATEPSVTTPPATEAPATETPSHVHSYKETVVAPTCSEKGYTIHKCSCGDSYKDTYVDASGHSWSNWTTTKEATTSAEGEQTRTCGRCQETETQAIAKLPATETISTSELQAYGMSYGASLGFTLEARRKILCKRFSTKSRISRFQCA